MIYNDANISDEERGRPWPKDPRTPGFVTRKSRKIHSSEDCFRYQQGIRNSLKYGRTVHPPQPTTTGEARAKGMAPCRHCW